ncbi:hypothetical protein MASR2M12_24430 [Bacteroidales bacterium]
MKFNAVTFLLPNGYDVSTPESSKEIPIIKRKEIVGRARAEIHWHIFQIPKSLMFFSAGLLVGFIYICSLIQIVLGKNILSFLDIVSDNIYR